jgi:hypothetical protein
LAKEALMRQMFAPACVLAFADSQIKSVIRNSRSLRLAAGTMVTHFFLRYPAFRSGLDIANE